jgi:hypothetical protein
MKWKRRFLRGLLGFVILFDLIVFVQFHTHGRPVIVTGRSLGQGRAEFSVTRVPVSAGDWLIGALIVSIEGLVVYANLRIKRGPAQAPAKIVE